MPGHRTPLFMTLGLFLAAPSRPAAPAPNHELSQARDLASRGRLEDALRILRSLTEVAPSPETWNDRAVLEARSGDLQAAAHSLRAALEADSSTAIANRNLEALYAHMARLAYDSALQESDASRPNPPRLQFSPPPAPPAVDSLSILREALRRERDASREARERGEALAKEIRSLEDRLGATETRLAQAEREAERRPPTRAVPPATPTPVLATTPVPRHAPAATDTREAEPAARPSSTLPPKVAPTTDSVQAALSGWAEAWSSRDPDRYLACYADSFQVPTGHDRAGWEALRRQRVTAPSSIQVDLSNVRLRPLPDGTFEAQFLQTYQTESTRLRSRKRIVFAREGARWRILIEGEAPR